MMTGATLAADGTALIWALVAATAFAAFAATATAA